MSHWYPEARVHALQEAVEAKAEDADNKSSEPSGAPSAAPAAASASTEQALKPNQEATEEEREAREAEFEEQLRARLVRSDLIGRDRHFRRYWWLQGARCCPLQYESPMKARRACLMPPGWLWLSLWVLLAIVQSGL